MSPKSIYKQNRKRKLYDMQNGLCHWCNLPMDIDGDPQGTLAVSIDHFGRRFDELGNPTCKPRPVVVAHRLCNSERHHDPSITNSTFGRIKRAATFRFPVWMRELEQKMA